MTIFPTYEQHLSRYQQIVLTVILVLLAPAQSFGSLISQKCLDRQAVFNTTTTIYHGAAVEPSIAVNPKNRKQIVAAWQKDRISNGSALEIGISYTKDGGKHWHKSTVPFQICKGGINQRVGDSWLSYSSDGSRVYLCAAVLNATQEPSTNKQSGIVVSVSRNGGKTWSEPHYLASSMRFISETMRQFANLDKNSITADPNDANRAIAVWVSFNPEKSFHGNAEGSCTYNGGKSWSAVQQIYDPFPDLTKHGLSNGIQNDNQASDNIVVILPEKKGYKKRRLSGDWLNFTVRVYATPQATDTQYVMDAFPFKYTLTDIAVVRSKDHGKTWMPDATIVVPSFVNNYLYTGGYTYDLAGNITGGVGTLMRNDQTIPSYNVNPENGFLYVAYQSSDFRSDQLSQIGLVTSRDGGKTWSKGVQVSRTPANAANPQAFEPFIAITKNGRVGILYFDFRNDDRLNPNNTKMDAWLAIYQEVKDPKGGSTNIGLEFVEEIRLSNESYIAQNGPTTPSGVMTDSDYQFLVTHCNDFYAIYTKSFDGPFTLPSLFFVDPIHQAILLLDHNRRTVPFVSIIRNTKKGARLLSTTKL